MRSLITRNTIPTLPEAADAGRADREIALARRLELGCLAVVHDRPHQFSGVLGRQRLIGHRRHPAVDLEGRRKLGGQEKIGSLLAQQQLEQVVDETGGLVAIHQ